MKRARLHLALALLIAGPARLFAREHVAVSVPFNKFSQTLLASADLAERPYLVVPTTVAVRDEMLIGFKRGEAHARDREAVFEVRSYHPSAGRLGEVRATFGEANRTYYNGEFVAYSARVLSCFIDVQQGGAVERVDRLGLRESRSNDGGQTWSAPRRVGLIDGVEYGYLFGAVARGDRTYALAMRFANLAGGTSLFPPWPHAGSVDVIASSDHGTTWHFVRDLTQECGQIPINESALLPLKDGWLLACRGYDNHQWLVRTDESFQVKQRRNLTADFDSIQSYLGRPRLYEREGKVYLVGRNWTQPPGPRSPMQLCWFRIDPSTLGVETCVVLDNSERQNVVDGYYATAYWRDVAGVSLLDIITYKRADFATATRDQSFHAPDLIRLEFVWDEIK